MTKKILLDAALTVMKNSYSPYSRYKVASALRTESGKIFTGVNIENASYGATVCAERVAIWNSVSAEGAKAITEIVVLTKEGWSPCGLCRQVLSEFAGPKTIVHIAKLSGQKAVIKKSIPLGKLLPLAFSL